MAKRNDSLTIAARDAWRVLASHKVNSLLSQPISNPKVKKNIGVGVLTAPLHLAPASLSGFNVCPMATAGCVKACLHTAGNPAHMSGKRRARIARTKAFFKARDAFMVALAADIAALEKRAKRMRLKCGVRLNATSDIVWEKMPVTVDGRTYPSLMAMFPRVTFYDYTKRHNRRNLPANYSLTYSLAENNDVHAIEALAHGMNVATVFNVSRNKPLPATYMLGVGSLDMPHTFDVINGDEHDFRPADKRGVIVGLRAKGKAIGDQSGFVRTV